MTEISIQGEAFYINKRPTYPGRIWNGLKIEGLLLNSRMVQAIFDDLNPATAVRWAYPDTGQWDPERNTREFIAAMPEWKRHGLLAVTINLQGGSPEGYSHGHPWYNSAFFCDGELRPDALRRLKAILDAADALGMVVILGLFYFGQDENLDDESAVIRALDGTVQWLLDQDYRHILLEVNNECDVAEYQHEILTPNRVHELVARVRGIQKDGRRLLAGTSFKGGSIPTGAVLRESDFVLIHGNGVSSPQDIRKMVQQVRAHAMYHPMPILFNEDDHFSFDQPDYNFKAALSQYASWGYFDFRYQGETLQDGYQCPPVDWGINSPRKRAFFEKLHEITGGQG